MSTTYLLPIPPELAKHINEFAYKHVTTRFIENRKSIICHLIKYSYNGFNKNHWWMEMDRVQMQVLFCPTCGNYLLGYFIKTYCNCL